MRRLLILLLNIAIPIVGLIAIGAGFIAYDDSEGTPTALARAGVVSVIIFMFMGALQSWRTGLRRKIPPPHWRLPRPPKEKKRKKPVAAPVVSEPVPQAQPAPRQFAPIPLAEAAPIAPEAARPSMPTGLRRFIEQGEHVITTSQDP